MVVVIAIAVIVVARFIIIEVTVESNVKVVSTTSIIFLKCLEMSIVNLSLMLPIISVNLYPIFVLIFICLLPLPI